MKKVYLYQGNDEELLQLFKEARKGVQISLVSFDAISYFQWLNGEDDSPQKRQLWAEDVVARNTAASLKAMDRVSKKCVICGKDFKGTGKSKFCSNACKQKDKRRKKKVL